MLLIAFECCFLSLLKNVLCLSAAYNALYIECIGRLFPSNWTRVVCLINLCSSALLNFFQTMSHTNNQCLCPFFFHIRCFPKIPDLARKRLILPQACYYPSINIKCYSFSPSKRCFIKWYFPFFWKLLILFLKMFQKPSSDFKIGIEIWFFFSWFDALRRPRRRHNWCW